jgi:hypothetical protein
MYQIWQDLIHCINWFTRIREEQVMPISDTTILAFKAAQEPLIELLRTHMERAYEQDTHVPRVVVMAYLAAQDRNMELLDV